MQRDTLYPHKSDGFRKELPVSDFELFEKWKNGKSIRDLAKKYKVSRQTITRNLMKYNEQEYNEIANSIAEHRKKIPALPNEVRDQWINGESTSTLAEKYHVSRQTISRILLKYDKDQYQKRVAPVGRDDPSRHKK